MGLIHVQLCVGQLGLRFGSRYKYDSVVFRTRGYLPGRIGALTPNGCLALFEAAFLDADSA